MFKEETERTSFGRGLREEGANRVETPEAAEEEEGEWWRERVCGVREKNCREAAMATACCVCEDKVCEMGF